MCIVLFTTAHPEYSLILIDNRDEYILRPTSLPHWWRHPSSGDEVLSSRDLQRAAKGTWLGITRTGILAVLTNYRETEQPYTDIKSRGQIMNAWLGGLPDHGLREGVDGLFKDGGVQGVGGFSMVCGKLKRKNQGIAIVSNRAANPNDVPIIGLDQAGFWGLSNTVYCNPEEWPKVTRGKSLLKKVVSEAVAENAGEERLIKKLFSILDQDTMVARPLGSTMQEHMDLMKHTLFVPLLGDEEHKQRMHQAASKGRAPLADGTGDMTTAEELLAASGAKQPAPVFEEGMYGTQRQTVILVDLDGNVTFVERALWDANGNELPRGENDTTVRFKIDGWDD